jgi:hypothetical protein
MQMAFLRFYYQKASYPYLRRPLLPIRPYSIKASGTLNDRGLFQMLRKSVFSTSGKGFSQLSLTVGLNDNGMLKNSCKILQLEHDASVLLRIVAFNLPKGFRGQET